MVLCCWSRTASFEDYTWKCTFCIKYEQVYFGGIFSILNQILILVYSNSGNILMIFFFKCLWIQFRNIYEYDWLHVILCTWIAWWCPLIKKVWGNVYLHCPCLSSILLLCNWRTCKELDGEIIIMWTLFCTHLRLLGWY